MSATMTIKSDEACNDDDAPTPHSISAMIASAFQEVNDDPPTMAEALSSQHADALKNAMRKEYEA